MDKNHAQVRQVPSMVWDSILRLDVSRSTIRIHRIIPRDIGHRLAVCNG